jgi:hypothetical protein
MYDYVMQLINDFLIIMDIHNHIVIRGGHYLHDREV